MTDRIGSVVDEKLNRTLEVEIPATFVGLFFGGKPDLVTNIDVSNVTPVFGEKLSATYTVTNVGGGVSPATDILTGNPVSIKNRVPRLFSGQSYSFRLDFAIGPELAQPFDLNGQEVYSSASIGVLQSTEKHLTAEDMMRDADTAMYQAKRKGKARHEVFDPDMHEHVKQTLQLETDLRRAVENDEFSVFYQPIYSLSTDQIEGFEALARWEHPKMGNISPDRFIPLAEEIGLIDTLGEQILRKACRQIQSIQNSIGDEKQLILNVNLSCKQFAHPQLVKKIRHTLSETGFAPENLKLEITESVFFEHKDRAIAMLKELRDHKIEINIDDFGTGYSNLSYLTKLPISTLKIDRTFVDSIESGGGNSEIVQTIIALARSLGMKVIAEGVENEIQLEQLRQLDCEGAQGYFFAKPMPFEEVEEFVNNMPDVPPPGLDQVPIQPTVQ